MTKFLIIITKAIDVWWKNWDLYIAICMGGQKETAESIEQLTFGTA